ncbi:flagellar motor switch protein FliM [Caminicella sporogenes DSM 14501]|uniref:Flagellar motor switch protein FliM n=1 Tax=Caminicella sporogenes DSM 14501 TaxID=1121266 RepID=A0A1M6LBT2_9FIRM|nr:flagellar motor switch protein FliM [Caminicella sporogenes]RKD27777.1 flagellar motor switch protein FliM [Caminicella sporogenes]SHJ68624.1 flagellar motor switch protein FliM [Caminicella sporogenes DSM 14501]
MSDVLSQSEIDELLQALSAGELDVQDIKEENKEKKIKKYDFRRPDKFAKDQLRTLQIIHENFSRLLNTFLSGYLRTYINVEVISVEQLTYYEFSNSISNPAVLGIINFKPMSGQVILDISTDIAFTMIERVLGGTGKLVKEVRSFTEIELTLLKKIIIKINKLLTESWENIVELNPSLDKIETNSQFAQIVSPNETIALITMSIKVGNIEGLINICIPHLVIEPIIQKLSTKLWFSSNNKEISDSEKKALQVGLKKANVEVKAIIGESTITVGDFLNLQVGDVIPLNTKIDEDIKIIVGDKLKFLGKPGLKKKNLAIKITDLVEEGDE